MEERIYKKWERRNPKQFCSCGLWVYNPMSKVHREATFHRNRIRLRKMLDEDCINFTEIGKTLGITRERVRQLAKKMGYKPGQKRQVTCSLHSMWAKWKTNPRYRFLLAKGYKIFPVMRKAFNRPYHVPSYRLYRINGKIVYLMGVSYRLPHPGLISGSITLATPKTKADFYIATCTTNSAIGTYIFPADKMPKNQTTWSPNPDYRRATKTLRHDFLDYHEAWHLLAP